MSLEASMRDLTLIWVPVTIVDIHRALFKAPPILGLRDHYHLLAEEN